MEKHCPSCQRRVSVSPDEADNCPDCGWLWASAVVPQKVEVTPPRQRTGAPLWLTVLMVVGWGFTWWLLLLAILAWLGDTRLLGRQPLWVFAGPVVSLVVLALGRMRRRRWDATPRWMVAWRLLEILFTGPGSWLSRQIASRSPLL